MQNICVFCHRAGSLAANTALIFQMGRTAEAEEFNLAVLDTYVMSMGAQWLLDKTQGLNNHGGGQQIISGTEPHTVLVNYLSSLTGADFVPNSAQKAAYFLESPEATFRRASLILTGSIPAQAKLNALVDASDEKLRQEIKKLMQGSGFHEFIKRGANDQLLVRSLKTTRLLVDDFSDYYPVFNEIYSNTIPSGYNYAGSVMAEVAEAPLELIAHVVEHDRPYTEVLTADYTMVSAKTAEVFKTGLSPAEGEFVPAVNQGQHISGNHRSYPRWDWNGSVQLRMPHAGILSEPAFLQQYPTTPTNRNRARSRWTYMHFLGFDIEASAARTISASALQDVDNPTLNNDACTVCHKALDPVAGAFQNFYEEGIYRAGPNGLDSLDHAYRATKLYTKGDTWYADMLMPGFGENVMSEQGDSLQQLAQLIVEDPRFAQAAVKFWWPAVFGEAFFSPDLTAQQFDAKSKTLAAMADSFAKSNFNLRDLLADFFMSDWFRAQQLNEEATADEVAVYTGGTRLLTPEELAAKTLSLTNIMDKPLLNSSATLYGGIDSVGVDKRQRDLSHIMLRAAERHALSSACKIVATEFNLPVDARRLFTLVERQNVPGPAFAASTALATTETRSIAHSITMEQAPGQTLHLLVTQLNLVNEGYTANNITLESIEVLKPDGSVLVSGAVPELLQQYEWISGNPLNATTNPYRIRKGYDLKMAIPVEQAGAYQIVLTVKAHTAGAVLDVAFSPQIYLAEANDSNTRKFRQQIAYLIERMHGKNVAEDSVEVMEYMQLFINLRDNKLRRASPTNLVETNIRCDYDSGGISRSIWGADPQHTLTAWRGLITALMTDFDYLYE